MPRSVITFERYGRKYKVTFEHAGPKPTIDELEDIKRQFIEESSWGLVLPRLKRPTTPPPSAKAPPAPSPSAKAPALVPPSAKAPVPSLPSTAAPPKSRFLEAALKPPIEVFREAAALEEVPKKTVAARKEKAPVAPPPPSAPSLPPSPPPPPKSRFLEAITKPPAEAIREIAASREVPKSVPSVMPERVPMQPKPAVEVAKAPDLLRLLAAAPADTLTEPAADIRSAEDLDRIVAAARAGWPLQRGPLVQPLPKTDIFSIMGALKRAEEMQRMRQEEEERRLRQRVLGKGEEVVVYPDETVMIAPGMRVIRQPGTRGVIGRAKPSGPSRQVMRALTPEDVQRQAAMEEWERFQEEQREIAARLNPLYWMGLAALETQRVNPAAAGLLAMERAIAERKWPSVAQVGAAFKEQFLSPKFPSQILAEHGEADLVTGILADIVLDLPGWLIGAGAGKAVGAMAAASRAEMLAKGAQWRSVGRAFSPVIPEIRELAPDAPERVLRRWHAAKVMQAVAPAKLSAAEDAIPAWASHQAGKIYATYGAESSLFNARLRTVKTIADVPEDVAGKIAKEAVRPTDVAAKLQAEAEKTLETAKPSTLIPEHPVTAVVPERPPAQAPKVEPRVPIQPEGEIFKPPPSQPRIPEGEAAIPAAAKERLRLSQTLQSAKGLPPVEYVTKVKELLGELPPPGTEEFLDIAWENYLGPTVRRGSVEDLLSSIRDVVLSRKNLERWLQKGIPFDPDSTEYAMVIEVGVANRQRMRDTYRTAVNEIAKTDPTLAKTLRRLEEYIGSYLDEASIQEGIDELTSTTIPGIKEDIAALRKEIADTRKAVSEAELEKVQQAVQKATKELEAAERAGDPKKIAEAREAMDRIKGRWKVLTGDSDVEELQTQVGSLMDDLAGAQEELREAKATLSAAKLLKKRHPELYDAFTEEVLKQEPPAVTPPKGGPKAVSPVQSEKEVVSTPPSQPRIPQQEAPMSAMAREAVRLEQIAESAKGLPPVEYVAKIKEALGEVPKFGTSEFAILTAPRYAYFGPTVRHGSVEELLGSIKDIVFFARSVMKRSWDIPFDPESAEYAMVWELWRANQASAKHYYDMAVAKIGETKPKLAQALGALREWVDTPLEHAGVQKAAEELANTTIPGLKRDIAVLRRKIAASGEGATPEQVEKAEKALERAKERLAKVAGTWDDAAFYNADKALKAAKEARESLVPKSEIAGIRAEMGSLTMQLDYAQEQLTATKAALSAANLLKKRYPELYDVFAGAAPKPEPVVVTPPKGGPGVPPTGVEAKVPSTPPVAKAISKSGKVSEQQLDMAAGPAYSLPPLEYAQEVSRALGGLPPVGSEAFEALVKKSYRVGQYNERSIAGYAGVVRKALELRQAALQFDPSSLPKEPLSPEYELARRVHRHIMTESLKSMRGQTEAMFRFGMEPYQSLKLLLPDLEKYGHVDTVSLASRLRETTNSAFENHRWLKDAKQRLRELSGEEAENLKSEIKRVSKLRDELVDEARDLRAKLYAVGKIYQKHYPLYETMIKKLSEAERRKIGVHKYARASVTIREVVERVGNDYLETDSIILSKVRDKYGREFSATPTVDGAIRAIEETLLYEAEKGKEFVENLRAAGHSALANYLDEVIANEAIDAQIARGQATKWLAKNERKLGRALDRYVNTRFDEIVPIEQLERKYSDVLQWGYAKQVKARLDAAKYLKETHPDIYKRILDIVSFERQEPVDPLLLPLPTETISRRTVRSSGIRKLGREAGAFDLAVLGDAAVAVSRLVHSPYDIASWLDSVIGKRAVGAIVNAMKAVGVRVVPEKARAWLAQSIKSAGVKFQGRSYLLDVKGLGEIMQDAIDIEAMGRLQAERIMDLPSSATREEQALRLSAFMGDKEAIDKLVGMARRELGAEGVEAMEQAIATGREKIGALLREIVSKRASGNMPAAKRALDTLRVVRAAREFREFMDDADTGFAKQLVELGDIPPKDEGGYFRWDGKYGGISPQTFAMRHGEDAARWVGNKYGPSILAEMAEELDPTLGTADDILNALAMRYGDNRAAIVDELARIVSKDFGEGLYIKRMFQPGMVTDELIEARERLAETLVATKNVSEAEAMEMAIEALPVIQKRPRGYIAPPRKSGGTVSASVTAHRKDMWEIEDLWSKRTSSDRIKYRRRYKEDRFSRDAVEVQSIAEDMIEARAQEILAEDSGLPVRVKARFLRRVVKLAERIAKEHGVPLELAKNEAMIRIAHRMARRSFKINKPIAPEKLAQLGRIVDPEYLAARSALDTASDLAKLRMFKALRTGKLIGYDGREISILTPEGSPWWAPELTADLADKGWVAIPNTKGWGAIRGGALHPHAWEAVRAIQDTRSGWERVVDRLMSTWKWFKTVGSLPTHVRNFLANFVFAQYAGVSITDLKNAKYYLNSLAALRRGASDPTGLYQLLVHDSIIDSGFINSELRSHLAQILQRYGPSGDPVGIMMAVRKSALRAKSKAENFLNFWYNAEDMVFKGAAYQKAFEEALRKRGYGLANWKSAPKEIIREARLAGKSATEWFADYGKWQGTGSQQLRRYFLPFASFSFESTRIFLKALREKPLLLASQIATLYLAQKHLRMALGLTDEEWSELVSDMRPFDRGAFNLPIPWRDEDGNIKVIGIHEYLPIGDIIGSIPTFGYLGSTQLGGGNILTGGGPIGAGLFEPLESVAEIPSRVLGQVPLNPLISAGISISHGIGRRYEGERDRYSYFSARGDNWGSVLHYNFMNLTPTYVRHAMMLYDAAMQKELEGEYGYYTRDMLQTILQVSGFRFRDMERSALMVGEEEEPDQAALERIRQIEEMVRAR